MIVIVDVGGGSLAYLDALLASVETVVSANSIDGALVIQRRALGRSALQRPSVFVLNVGALGKAAAIDATRRLVAADSTVQVVGLMPGPSEAEIQDFIEAGAYGGVEFLDAQQIREVVSRAVLRAAKARPAARSAARLASASVGGRASVSRAARRS